MATVTLTKESRELAARPAAANGKRMVTFVYEGERVSVPEWVTDLDSFRRWADADDFPQTGRVWYLKGEVWVDMSRDQLFSHLAIKAEFDRVLGGLVKAGRLGLFFPDGLFLSNVAADIGGNPDATFISYAALDARRIRMLEGAEGGFVEVEGSPDVVLEVISPSSVRKDKVTLRQAYWEAGVREYWLVDARREPLRFEILRRTTKGFSTSRNQDGWLKSAAFGCSFRLVQTTDRRGHPEFTLEVR
jgi:Uma2 family endonuclease